MAAKQGCSKIIERELNGCAIASRVLGTRFVRRDFPATLRRRAMQYEQLDDSFYLDDELIGQLSKIRPDGYYISQPAESSIPLVNLLEVEYSNHISDDKMQAYAFLWDDLESCSWELRLFRSDRWAHITEMELSRLYLPLLCCKEEPGSD